MDSSPSGSSVHGILQARILECVAFPFPGDLLDPEIETTSPALASGFFTTEPPGKPIYIHTHTILILAILCELRDLSSPTRG